MGCCADSNFGCYKKPSSHFALCKPLQASCEDTHQWLCPGWEKCTEDLADCSITRCCSNPGFSCYHKQRGQAFCLPTGSCEMEWAGQGADCSPFSWPPPPSP